MEQHQFSGYFNQSHDFAVELEREQIAQAQQEKNFSKIWREAKKVIGFIILIPLPKKWKTILKALLVVGEEADAIINAKQSDLPELQVNEQ